MEVIPLDQQVLGEVIGLVAGAALFGIQSAVGGGDLEIVVAVNPGDFLDDVRLDGHVLGGPPGGNFHLELAAVKFGAKAQRAQGAEDLVIADLNARVPVHIGLVEGQGHSGILLAVHIGQPGNHLGLGIDVQQQLHKPADGGEG